MNNKLSVLGGIHSVTWAALCIFLSFYPAPSLRAQTKRQIIRRDTRGRDWDEYDQQTSGNFPYRKKYRRKTLFKPIILPKKSEPFQNGIYLGVPVGTSLASLWAQNTEVKFNYYNANDRNPHLYNGLMKSATRQQPYWNGFFGIESGYLRGPFMAVKVEFGEASDVFSAGLEVQAGVNYELKNSPWMLSLSVTEEVNHTFYTLPQTINVQYQSVSMLGQQYNYQSTGGEGQLYERITNSGQSIKCQFSIRHSTKLIDEPHRRGWWRLSAGYIWTITSNPGLEIKSGHDYKSIAYPSSDLQISSASGPIQNTFSYTGPYLQFDFSLGGWIFFKKHREAGPKHER